MAVTAVQKISAEAYIDKDGYKNVDVVFQVTSDTNNDGPLTIIENMGVTAGDTYTFAGESNTNVWLQHLGPAKWRDDNKKSIWLVPGFYSNKPINKKTPATSPIDEPWEISGSYVRLSRFTCRDKDGKMICNSAWQPKISEVPYGHDTLRLEGPSANLNLATRRAARFRCNANPIWGHPERTLLMSVWSFSCPWYGTTQYVRNQIEIDINDEGWNEVFLDEGTQRIALVNGKYRQVDWYNTDKKRIEKSPFLLDGSGQPLEETNPIAIAGEIPEGVFLTRMVIQEFDFSSLGFPDPLPGPFV